MYPNHRIVRDNRSLWLSPRLTLTSCVKTSPHKRNKEIVKEIVSPHYTTLQIRLARALLSISTCLDSRHRSSYPAKKVASVIHNYDIHPPSVHSVVSGFHISSWDALNTLATAETTANKSTPAIAEQLTTSVQQNTVQALFWNLCFIQPRVGSSFSF